MSGDSTDARPEPSRATAKTRPSSAGRARRVRKNLRQLFEGGHDLSGGEWQRLALARIMYRDADIWILDEELLQARGRYAQLFELQAAGYR